MFPATRYAVTASLAALLLLASSGARANDRDLRAVTVPPSACVEIYRNFPYSQPGIQGVFKRGLLLHVCHPVVRHSAAGASCPLPISNIDLSGTTNDNDISEYRVFYTDPDGAGNQAYVTVFLGRGPVGNVFRNWNSNTGASGATSAVVPCAHDVAANALYYFYVDLVTSYDVKGSVRFYGITFP